MLIIKKEAHSRLGLIGNPSDGYNGKTISISCPEFSAEIVLYEWDTIEILQSENDRRGFDSIYHLARDVKLNGYYGGIRLIKATLKKFVEYCAANDLSLHDQNFAIRYSTSIPRAVGLGGSSAIVIATLKCLLEFYHVEIPTNVLPSIALAVETDELHIPAGLQDRVIQVFGGVVYMDFSKETMREEQGYQVGVYERIDPGLLPPVYMAYSRDSGEPTEVLHNDLRERHEKGDKRAVAAMERFAELTDETLHALKRGAENGLWENINSNFDLRNSICRIPQKQLRMVEKARTTGACAKFAGSGGAIVGYYRDDSMFARLVSKLAAINCRVFKVRL